MPQKTTIPMPFPLGGVDESTAYRTTPPFRSPRQRNVRGFGTLEGRARGGQRPGLGRTYARRLGGVGGAPINMLSQLTIVHTDTDEYEFYYADEFDRDGATLGVGWSKPVWLDEEAPTKKVMSGALTFKNPCGGVRDQLEVDTGSLYTVSIKITPWKNKHWGSYRIYARMDNSAPDVTEDGIEVRLNLSGSNGAYEGRLYSREGGVTSSWALTAGNTGSATSGWFTVDINGDNVQVAWKGIALANEDVHTHTDRRVGFGMRTTGTWASGLCLTDVFRVTGAPTSCEVGLSRDTMLVPGAGGNIYRTHDFTGEITRVTGDVANIHSGHLIQATERLQKLYIADWGLRCLCLDDGVITTVFPGDPANTVRLTHAEIADWTAYGIDVNTDVVVITNGTNGGDPVVNGTYTIFAVQVGFLALNVPAADMPMNGNCSFKVERGPKVYDPKLDAGSQVELWTATTGEVPTGCPMIARYRGRLVLAGSPPHEWYMSRQTDPLDWDYSQLDDQSAVSGASSDAYVIGDIITAVIPFHDDYLIFGCIGSLWILRGDAQMGGQIDCGSRTVGIVDRGAWCWGERGELYFLSSSGLWCLAPGADAIRAPFSSEVLTPLSRERLPRQLQGIDTHHTEVLLGWDEAARGVHIYLTPKPFEEAIEPEQPATPWPTATATHGATATATLEPPGTAEPTGTEVPEPGGTETPWGDGTEPAWPTGEQQ